jgi:hypothetical protein
VLTDLGTTFTLVTNKLITFSGAADIFISPFKDAVAQPTLQPKIGVM